MREAKMRKASAISLIAAIAIAMTLQMIPFAYAVHEAEVVWKETGTMTLAKSVVPTWLNFTVKNQLGDAIVRIKFTIPKNATGYVLFRYWTSEQNLTGWSATPDEFDPTGWPGVIIFEGPGFNLTTTGEFDIHLPEARVTVCEYVFMVYTIDNGSTPVTHPHELYLILDPTPPDVTIVEPEDGAVITGIWDPYPVSHYMWVNVTATDNLSIHNTNISRIQIYVDDILWIDKPYTPPVKDPTIKEKLWNLTDGEHTVNATAFDGVGNSISVKHTFTYKAPTALFFVTPEKGTVGPITTYDPKTGLYSGSIYTYRTKRLGTNATVYALSDYFTPNSKVNVTVYHPVYKAELLVVKNAPTDETGAFKAWFLFPTAPHGVYKVTATDAKGITDKAWFTVVPEIIYKPDIVIGPAIVEVIATGLTSNGTVQRFLSNGTDALLGINLQTVICWETNDNGILVTIMADKPGFFVPVIETGAYEIALDINGGYYWDGKVQTWEPLDIVESNYVYVANDFKGLMSAINALGLKLDGISAKIVAI